MNYFNTLSLREQLLQLGVCRFMDKAEFADDVNALKGKKIVIVGAGAQGLNQGLNLRDSGLDVSYALRKEAIAEKRPSWKNTTDNGFKVGTYEELIPTADIVGNLTPDKQHSSVIDAVMPLMKKGASLWYSHGFNIVEEGKQIRKDITVVMMAPKGPGSEVREEYKRGFGIPTLIAVHPENDPEGKGWAIAKALASGTGGARAGVLASSFVAEVKSDLMGEQTILCGMLQTGSLLCFDKLVEKGVDKAWAAKFIQYGWETVTEALKFGGISLMMDRLSNPAKVRANELAAEIKKILAPLYRKHQDDIISGAFSSGMMKDWAAGDKDLLAWREATGKTPFEQTAGIKAESAYYESLHETPLIANLIARKKLYEMNKVISDTAEYGCYLFDNAARPMLKDFMKKVDLDIVGKGLALKDTKVSNQLLNKVNDEIRNHPVEIVGKKLRAYMTAMKAIVS